MRLGLNKERMVHLFKEFDEDNSGNVDDEEFVKCLFPGGWAAIYSDRERDEAEEAIQESIRAGKRTSTSSRNSKSETAS